MNAEISGLLLEEGILSVLFKVITVYVHSDCIAEFCIKVTNKLSLLTDSLLDFFNIQLIKDKSTVLINSYYMAVLLNSQLFQ